jgi:branched-chain amino acid transport system substrate-binding protein
MGVGDVNSTLRVLPESSPGRGRIFGYPRPSIWLTVPGGRAAAATRRTYRTKKANKGDTLSKIPIRTIQLATAIGAAALTVAACSSSPSTSAAGASSISSSTIVVGGMAPLTSQVLTQPEIEAGIVAAVDALNAQGGIDGHHVKLDYCDTQYTSSGEISCMDQMISNKVSALIAPSIAASATGSPFELSQAADLASIGGLGEIVPELTSPAVFPLAGGDPGWVYGAMADLVKGGARRIAVLGNAIGSYEAVKSYALAALKQAGLTPVNVSEGDPNSDPTFAAAAAKAVSGNIDGMYLAVSPNNVPIAVRAVRAAGYTGPIASIAAAFTPPIIKALGSQGNGIELSGNVAFPSQTGNPAVTAYLADMAKYQPQGTIDQLSETSWAGMMLFAKAMKGQTNFSASHVLSVMKNLSTPIDLGVTGPYAVKNSVSPIPGFPSIHNPTITLGVLQDGVIKPQSGPTFVNPVQVLNAASHG